MKVRLISGIIVAVIALAAICFGGIVMNALVLFCAAVAMYEFYNAFRCKGFAPITGAGILMLLIPASAFFTDFTYPGVIEFSTLGGVNIFPLVITVSIFCVLAAMVFDFKKHTAADGAVTLFGGFYTAYLFSYFIILRNLDAGAYMLVLAIIGAVGADTAAFIIGSKFGKKKLAPAVSPNKTVAGSVAAFAGSTVLCTVFGVILRALGIFRLLPLYHYIVIGVILGAVSQVGDLCASAIKRYCGIKDFGNIIPGHGGILDRFDAYLLTVPVIYYYYAVFLAI